MLEKDFEARKVLFPPTNGERRDWSERPATKEQLKCLRLIANHTGRTFSVGIDRGAAWARINRCTSVLDARQRRACAPPWNGGPSEDD